MTFFASLIVILLVFGGLFAIDMFFAPAESPRWSCSVCGRRYPREETLQLHLKTHRQVCCRVPGHEGDCVYVDQDDPFYIDDRSEQCGLRKDRR